MRKYLALAVEFCYSVDIPLNNRGIDNPLLQLNQYFPIAFEMLLH